MTVKELRTYLNKLDESMDDLQVILQKDSEGNGYSPLAGADDDCIYEPDNTYSGIVYSSEDAEEEGVEGDKVLVLYPTN